MGNTMWIKMYPVITTSTLLIGIVLCLTVVAQSDAACPQGKQKFMNCTNSCLSGNSTVFCESDQNTTCRPDYCGGCIARFFDDVGQEVHCEKKHAFICEFQNHTIGCLDQPGTVLNVSYANYGRTSTTVCVHPSGLEHFTNTTTCVSPTTLGIVRQQCDGRTQCTLTADNDLMGDDPCFGIYKYLEVEVECVQSEAAGLAAQSLASCCILMVVSLLLVRVSIN